MEVCDAWLHVLAPVYLWSLSLEEEWRQLSAEFLVLWNFSHRIRGIDGTHVAEECPKNTGYLNYNCNWSCEFSQKYCLLSAMQNISLFSLTSDNKEVQTIMLFSETLKLVETSRIVSVFKILSNIYYGTLGENSNLNDTRRKNLIQYRYL